MSYLKRINVYGVFSSTKMEWATNHSRWKTGKLTTLWKLNDPLINNKWMIEESIRGIITYFKTNENKIQCIES